MNARNGLSKLFNEFVANVGNSSPECREKAHRASRWFWTMLTGEEQAAIEVGMFRLQYAVGKNKEKECRQTLMKDCERIRKRLLS